MWERPKMKVYSPDEKKCQKRMTDYWEPVSNLLKLL